jgi:hypothetical protein
MCVRMYVYYIRSGTRIWSGNMNKVCVYVCMYYYVYYTLLQVPGDSLRIYRGNSNFIYHLSIRETEICELAYPAIWWRNSNMRV